MTGRIRLKEVFNRYANVVEDGELYMTTDTFIHQYLELYNDESSPTTNNSCQIQDNRHKNKYVTNLFCNILSKSKPGLITFQEFEDFEHLLSEPDALYRLLFELFDINRNGLIGFNEFHEITKHTENYQILPESFSSSQSAIIQLYFGKDRNHLLNYNEFCQFIHDFNEEFIQKIFQKYDYKNSGFIKIEDFYTIMTTYDGHLLTPIILKHMVQLASNYSCKLNSPEITEQEQQARMKYHQQKKTKHLGLDYHCNLRKKGKNNTFGKISYSFYSTFHHFLRKMTMIKLMYLHQTLGLRSTYLSRQDFLDYLNLRKEYNCQLNVTPAEFEILFELVDLIKIEIEKEKPHNHQKTKIKIENLGKLKYSDLILIAPDFKPMTKCEKIHLNKRPVNPNRSVEVQIYENAYRFALGAIAGAIGAFVVYPMDLIKTRMQSQKTKLATPVRSSIAVMMRHPPLYANSFDCVRKIVKAEGIPGLYRGLVVQLVGVSPEKAIKLAVNDLLRDTFTNPKDCEITLVGEIIAGTVAGISQCVITNPLEIVKIRLQTAGEVLQQRTVIETKAPLPPPPKPSAFQVIKELGIKGLYQGYRACMLRDVTFNATYFTTYSRIKGQLEDETGYNAPWTLLVSALIAGVPASTLATPADLIKTRLQVKHKPGDTPYTGILDAAHRIHVEEGFKAFFKGVAPRILRSCPQFAITIFGYELLQRYLHIDFGGNQKPRGAVPRDELIRQIKIKEHKEGLLSKDTVKLLEVSSTVENPDITNVKEDRIGGYRYASQLFKDIQTKFGFTFLKST